MIHEDMTKEQYLRELKDLEEYAASRADYHQREARKYERAAAIVRTAIWLAFITGMGLALYAVLAR